MNNYIKEYYNKILSGEITAGRYIKLWYEYIDKGLKEGSFFYDEISAERVIRFCETFCRHHEGALAPQKIVLELWQKAFLSVVFGIKDSEGNRQFREVILLIGRKNGKTLLAAAIAAYCAYKDGEYGARIYMAAPKLQQANLCYDAFYQMVKKEPALEKRAKRRRTDIYVEESNSSITPLPFSAKRSDGLNISLCIADEVASWEGDAGLKFYEVIKSSFGARKQPLLLNITTAGYINDGPYDELMKRSTRVLLGESEETRLAPFLYMIDDLDKWNSIEELKKSNPNLGVSITEEYLKEEIAIADGSLSKKAEAIVKYANIKQNSSLAWLNAQDVQRAVSIEHTLEEFRGCYCVGGIDLSRTTDLTSCCVIIEKNKKLYIISKFFLPAEKIDEATARDNVPYREYIKRGLLQPSGDNFVDYHDCFNWFVSLVRDYKILPLKVGYDRYCAQYLVQDMTQFGFHMDDVYQGTNLYPVLMEFEGLLKDGSIDIGNNDLLKIHLLNSAIKMDTEQNKGKLVKINPNDHIDGTAALTDAMCVRQKWYGEIGLQLANEGK